MFKRKVITALDIGTSKVCIAVAKIEGAQKQRLLDFSSAESGGYRNGTVTDIGKLTDCIDKAFNKLKNTTKPMLSTVFLSLNGAHITSQHSRAMITLPEKNSEITRKDLKRCITLAGSAAISYDNDLIHTVNLSHIVDGQAGVENPIGMFGNKLETECYVITGKSSAVQNVIKAANYAGFEVEGTVWSGLASGFSCLSDTERDMGAALVEIGAGLTNVAIFSDKRLRFSKTFFSGADELTESLTTQLRIPFNAAIRLKESYGRICDRYGTDINLQESVPITGLSEERTITRGQVLDALEPAVETLLRKINNSLYESDCIKEASSGAVITGGGSLLDGFAEKAESIFNMPVRIGIPKNIQMPDPTLNAPQYATVLGLVDYGFQRLKEFKSSNSYIANPLVRSYLAVKDFLGDYF